jgi:prepilin-type N-terminal cleavage/methylation domain-containing protein
MRTDRGFSLVELTVAAAIILVMAAVATPVFRAHFADAHILGAAQQFQARFRLASSTAVRSSVYTAIRFERHDDGRVYHAVYADGDGDGVRSADIATGTDRMVAEPVPLEAGAPGVRVGFNAGVPDPGGNGTLGGDPIRFGSSDLLSFSPYGTATPGTFYLAGDSVQAAVRVTGGSARVRVMLWRGGRWQVR